jgi:hypothetical protein
MVANFECKIADLSIWFLSQEEKRKKKRKIWDDIGTRLERIATRSGPSRSLSFGRPSHMQRNNSATWSQIQPYRCRHASMQHRARWLVPPRRLREARQVWDAYIMRPMGISAPQLFLPCLDSNDRQLILNSGYFRIKNKKVENGWKRLENV